MIVDEDKLNIEIRKFLKKVGITSQREIESAVRRAADSENLPTGYPLRATMHLTVDGIDLDIKIDGELSLD
ncbi:MAG: DUF6494 family protein [Pseudomonadota bacterium]